MKTRPFVPFAVSLIVCASAMADEKRDFPVEWKTGKTYVQAITMDQTTKVMGQGEMVMKMETEMTAVPAEGAKPATTDLTMTYRKIDMKMSMGGQEMPGMDGAMDPFVGKSIVVTFGKDGEVLAVSTEGLGDLEGNPMTAQMMNEESIKQMMAQGSLLGRPDEPVGPGGTWNFKFDFPNPMFKMVMTGTYTYEGDEERDGKKVARLTFDSTIEIVEAEPGEEDPEGMAAMMRNMGLKIADSKMTGTLYYDIALENFTRSEIDMSMTMTMNNPADGAVMEMPVKSRTVQTLSVQGAE